MSNILDIKKYATSTTSNHNYLKMARLNLTLLFLDMVAVALLSFR